MILVLLTNNKRCFGDRLLVIHFIEVRNVEKAINLVATLLRMQSCIFLYKEKKTMNTYP